MKAENSKNKTSLVNALNNTINGNDDSGDSYSNDSKDRTDFVIDTDDEVEELEQEEDASAQTHPQKSTPEISKIAVIHSYVKREFFPTEMQYITEKDARHDAEVIANEIKKLGIDAIPLQGDDSLTDALKKYDPDMAFNLVDSIKGKEYLSASIPGILDTMDIPFTGTGLLGLAICYNKFLSKQLLQSARVPVPNFQLFHSASDPINNDMRFPLISKLNEIHGAVEMDSTAVSENEKQLRERISYLIKTYSQPIVVEEFISGREITAYVIQGNMTKIYLAEKVFNKPDEKYVFATFDDNWVSKDTDKDTAPYYYEKYDDSLLKFYVKKAFDTTDMLDYAKFDIRLDASGRYYFIDSNANPAFGPAELDTAMGNIIQKLYGVSFQDILKRIINSTMDFNCFTDSPSTNGNGSNGHHNSHNNGPNNGHGANGDANGSS